MGCSSITVQCRCVALPGRSAALHTKAQGAAPALRPLIRPCPVAQHPAPGRPCAQVEAEASISSRPIPGFTPRQGAGIALFGKSFNYPPARPNSRIDFQFDTAAFYFRCARMACFFKTPAAGSDCAVLPTRAGRRDPHGPFLLHPRSLTHTHTPCCLCAMPMPCPLGSCPSHCPTPFPSACWATRPRYDLAGRLPRAARPPWTPCWVYMPWPCLTGGHAALQQQHMQAALCGLGQQWRGFPALTRQARPTA